MLKYNYANFKYKNYKKFMKKHILIIDWLLITAFILILISKFINLPFIKIIQPIFFVLIVIHIIQHLRIYAYSLKKLKK